MPANAISATTTAACPDSQGALAPDAGTAGTRREQPWRAADILTISGNPTLSVYLAGLFRECGWTIARAHTWAAGLSCLRQNRVAVAVCDETLPDGSWREVAAAFGFLPDAPALIVVGDDEGLVEKVLASGGFDALIRPLRESDVRWTVASAWHAWLKGRDASGTGAPRCSGA